MDRKKKDDELTMVDDATNAVQTNEQTTVDVSPTDITATDEVTVNAGAAVNGTEPSRKEARQAAQAERAQNALEAKAERRKANEARRDLYADEAVDLVAKTMQDTGLESVDEQTLATLLTPKQLWYFQKRYNPKSNWGTAAGGRALLGEMNESTVSELNRLASVKVKKQKTQQEEQDASDVPIKTKDGNDYIVGDVTISNKKLNEMKDWGSQITDPNEITPEQVAQLYEKLESYGVKVPKVQAVDANGTPLVDDNDQPIMKYNIGTDNMSLYDIKADLDEADPDDNGDMALDALGFRNDAGELVVPHRKTYEEMLAERAAAKERIDLLNQQKAADRAKLRLGLSDLAAGIGDMIKASGGAIVNPRDYQAKYDALTAQQKENFNNYLARMQKMKDEEKAKEQRAYESKLLKEERTWKEQQAELAHKRSLELLDTKLQGELSNALARYGADNANKILRGDAVYINSQAYPADEAKFRALYSYFNRNRTYITPNGVRTRLNFDTLNTEMFDTEGSKVAIALQVQKALEDFNQFPQPMKNNIMSILGSNLERPVERTDSGNNPELPNNFSALSMLNVSDTSNTTPQPAGASTSGATGSTSWWN